MSKTVTTGKLTWTRTSKARMESKPYSVVKFDGPNGLFYSAFVTASQSDRVLHLGVRDSFELAAGLAEHYELTHKRPT